MGEIINVALPKGRLGEAAYGIMEKAGYRCPGVLAPARKLFFESPESGVRYFWVKPSDVPVYVERGAADAGIAGLDILREHQPEVYELVDLGIGRCRMCVAGPSDFADDESRPLKVATKFPRIYPPHQAEWVHRTCSAARSVRCDRRFGGNRSDAAGKQSGGSGGDPPDFRKIYLEQGKL